VYGLADGSRHALHASVCEAHRAGTIHVAQSSFWYGMGPEGAEGRAHPASEARNRRARRGSATCRRVVRTGRGARREAVARDRFCHVGNPQPNAPNDRTPGDLARSSSWFSDAEGHGCRQGGAAPRRAVDAPDKETTREQRSVGLTLSTWRKRTSRPGRPRRDRGDRFRRKPEHASRCRLWEGEILSQAAGDCLELHPSAARLHQPGKPKPPGNPPRYPDPEEPPPIEEPPRPIQPPMPENPPPPPAQA
jgi:hypothetical protein